MRECEIDRVQVHLPNACTLGYSRHKARTGDLVTFRTGDHTVHMGRVLGRIKYAPARGDDAPAIRGALLVAQYSPLRTSLYQRWVDPSDVIECYGPHDQHHSKHWNDMRACVLELFDLPVAKIPPRTIIAWMEYGTASFRTWWNERLKIDEQRHAHAGTVSIARRITRLLKGATR